MSDSFLLLEDGVSFLLLQDGESFLIIEAEDEQSGGLPYYDPFAQRAALEFEAAREREKIKQEEIIRLRLEAQDALMRKRELSAARETKQSLRQIRALEKEYAALEQEVAYQLAALEELQKLTTKRKNNLILILLSAASPFASIAMH